MAHEMPADNDIRGAAAYVLHAYTHAAAHGAAAPRRELTLFAVKDHTHTYTCPLETRDRTHTHARDRAWEDVGRCASRVTDEELHLRFTQEEMEDGSLFQVVHVPYVLRATRWYSAVHILTRPHTRTRGFGVAAFQREVARLRELGASGCYLETTALAHLPVRALLEAVPENTYDDGAFEVDASRVEAVRGAALCDVMPVVLDVHGQPRRLRDVFAWTLSHPRVRACLRDALEAFDARDADAHAVHDS